MERVLESSGHEGDNKTEQERAEPATGARQAGRKNICMGRWAKFLITPSGEETCDFKLRAGLQLFSQDSFRVWHVLSFAGGMTRMLKACWKCFKGTWWVAGNGRFANLGNSPHQQGAWEHLFSIALISAGLEKARLLS